MINILYYLKYIYELNQNIFNNKLSFEYNQIIIFKLR